MHEAPPIIGRLEFYGLTNQIILVEHDEEVCGISLIESPINGKNNIIFSGVNEGINTLTWDASCSARIQSESLYHSYRILKSMEQNPFDFIIIRRIDVMDLGLHVRERGARIAAYLAMMSSRKILQGANVVITSAKSEYNIRKIANLYLNLRK